MKKEDSLTLWGYFVLLLAVFLGWIDEYGNLMSLFLYGMSIGFFYQSLKIRFNRKGVK